VIFERHEVADVSTGYLELSDLPLLLRSDCPTRFAETDGGFGTFHWVPNDGQLLEEELQHAASFGLSERFVSIFRDLGAAKIPYVRFDADGGEIQDLERAGELDVRLSQTHVGISASPERKVRRKTRTRSARRPEGGGSTA
jgi:hypothetical protein